ncbi:MAG: DUF4956 domain-containing protein [Gemmatimonadales bacterium]
MAEPLQRSFLDRLGEQPLIRVLAYYVALLAAAVLIDRFLPGLRSLIDTPDFGPVGDTFGLGEPAAELPAAPSDAAGIVTVVSVTVTSVALMLPVAWVYVMTRAKSGYRQSLVQTLMILPIVVAGVVGVVKNSIALAFGLAGIVAAVSFRNRLRDSKDAVVIFLAIAVGLACGVQASGIAAAVSIVFNVVMLLLWWSDFGRVPGALQGGAAEQRLRRALAVANRTHQFVSMVDQQILKSLAPEQLAQVANRVANRREKLEDVLVGGGGGGKGGRPTVILQIDVADGDLGIRSAIEDLLEQDAKSWRFLSSSQVESGSRLTYSVKLRKKVPRQMLVERVHRAAGPAVHNVEFTTEEPV